MSRALIEYVRNNNTNRCAHVY